MKKAKEIIRPLDLVVQYEGKDGLNVSELFTETIQGEGVYSGHPAVFFRLQGCLHNCVFCDTRQIWKNGNRLSFDALLEVFQQQAYKEFTEKKAHLVVTGGSPLQQQKPLGLFLKLLKKDFQFRTDKELFIEIENEAGVVPNKDMLEVIDCWNNSPKLKNSLVNRAIRFNARSLKTLNKLENSWFKFVISKPTDWNEIEKEFLPHISEEKIILMPMGITNEELDKSLEAIQVIAETRNVKVLDRQHIRENWK